jgi:hypothetical protein
MRIRHSAVLGGAAALGLAVALAWSSARASDHTDGPAASADPAADIGDLFAWMSADAASLNLVMTVGRNVGLAFTPSNRVQYVFHTTSRPSLGAPAGAEVNVICQFGTNSKASCWAGDSELVEGNAAGNDGLTSSSGRFKVFAGVRDDPFFQNLAGFQSVARTIGIVAPSLTLDAGGCPRLDALTANSLLSTLRTGKDDFAGFDTFAIVAVVDKTLVTRDGPIVSVWASTNRR